jgi:hypothetical protein
MQLQVCAGRIQRCSDDVTVDKAAVVINDDMCVWRENRGSPLEADECTLPVVDAIPWLLGRAWDGGEPDRCRALEDYKRAAAIIALRTRVEELMHVVRDLTRRSLVDHKQRLARLVGGAHNSKRQCGNDSAKISEVDGESLAH